MSQLKQKNKPLNLSFIPRIVLFLRADYFIKSVTFSLTVFRYGSTLQRWKLKIYARTFKR